MDLKSFIGATHEHSFQYYKQDPETGGYERHLSKGTTFTPLSPEQCSIAHHAEGGWQYANLPFEYWGGGGWNQALVPKLDPLIMVDGVNLKIAGKTVPLIYFKPKPFTQFFYNLHESVREIQNKARQLSRNLDKEGYPRDPVPRNYQREEWVERFMWRMGMSRSRYKPTFAERFPHVGSVRLYPREGDMCHEF